MRLARFKNGSAACTALIDSVEPSHAINIVSNRTGCEKDCGTITQGTPHVMSNSPSWLTLAHMALACDSSTSRSCQFAAAANAGRK